MKTDRRRFIKTAGVTVTGLLATDMTGTNAGQGIEQKDAFANTKRISEQEHRQFFNMCGYSAPKLETVRVGFIGLGNRCF